jgi:hypothetical protein
VNVDQFEPKAGDPLQEPVQGTLIWQLGAERRAVDAHEDLAVVEFRPQDAARPTDEGYFVCSC